MSTPVVRNFARDTDVRFPEEDTVPNELKEWWVETRENLERLKDRITSLEIQNETLTRKLSESSSIMQFTDVQVGQLLRFIQFWEIDSSGSLIPYTNNSSDIGNAGRKVRDIYEHQA
jgi:hypothetical protein